MPFKNHSSYSTLIRQPQHPSPTIPPLLLVPTQTASTQLPNPTKPLQAFPASTAKNISWPTPPSKAHDISPLPISDNPPPKTHHMLT